MRGEALYAFVMHAAPTMLYRCVDGTLVVLHTAQNPREDEWAEHCRFVESEFSRIRGVLVLSDGGGPNTKQRGMLRNVVKEAAPRTAIMTDSAIVRGIITSLKWFASDRFAAFARDDLQGALRHIAASGPSIDAGAVLATLSALARELAVELPGSFQQ